MLKQGMDDTATAKAAVVSDLKSVDSWNEKTRGTLEELIKISKQDSANFSITEKIFLVATKSCDGKLLANLL